MTRSDQELEALRAENARLKKINQALIQRVEESGSHIDPYSTFENSVHLSHLVQEKTKALNQALSQLEQTNRKLKLANQQSQRIQQQFIDAIESISDPFVLLDSEGRIVVQNSPFKKFWQASNFKTAKGINLKELKELAKSQGRIIQSSPSNREEPPIFQMKDGRSFQITERRTEEGGWVLMYTDITALKQAETHRYELAIAEKNQVLKNLVDNLSQGIVQYNDQNQIVIWNKKFIQFSQLNESNLESKPYIETVQPLTNLDLCPHSSDQKNCYVQQLPDNTILEVRDHRLPEGSLIKTFSDITQRHQYAESLKKNEQWLRLITDNLPAMIAYVGADLQLQFVNRGYANWYGLMKEQCIGKHIAELMPAEQFSKIQPFLAEALEGNSINFEIEAQDKLDNLARLIKFYVPNINHEQQVQGIFVLIRDITERHKNKQDFQQAYVEMEHRVKERTAQLQSLNEQFQIEIEQRKKIQHHLAFAKSEAEQANTSKSKFLAAVSHDLIQPLNAAQLFCGTLKESMHTEKQHNLLESVVDSLDNLESLISSLVDISKLEAGVIKADKSTFSIQDLMDRLVNEYRHFESRFSVRLNYVACNQMVYTDSSLVARILRNFLSNAFRYANKGRVLFGCKRDTNYIWVQVWDTGIGIAEDQKKHIFKEFKRASAAQSLYGQGLGLGLAIVERLSRVLDLKIKVESELGKGSVFSVRIPVQKDFKQTLPQAGRLPTTQPKSVQNASVWLVDNDKQICQSMRMLLESWGCRVVVAHDQEQLVEQVDIYSERPDMLILDYHLDDNKTGLQLAKWINQQTGNLPATLMITANYSAELKKTLAEHKILLLNKPIKAVKLRSAMHFLLTSDTD